ncbi:hypothetical protein [Bdellovibrio bacteriovorus]|uniref:hypothetical protein n=1 Tax=Bdellovibrio bacteriovorus TaxID=959 RepID=UPI000B12DA9B|nr:hypothetical protein [Bdellovibrio bacteriovorus]
MSKPSLKEKKSKNISSRNSAKSDPFDKKKIPSVKRTSEGTIEDSPEEAAP